MYDLHSWFESRLSRLFCSLVQVWLIFIVYEFLSHSWKGQTKNQCSILSSPSSTSTSLRIVRTLWNFWHFLLFWVFHEHILPPWMFILCYLGDLHRHNKHLNALHTSEQETHKTQTKKILHTLSRPRPNQVKFVEENTPFRVDSPVISCVSHLHEATCRKLA